MIVRASLRSKKTGQISIFIEDFGLFWHHRESQVIVIYIRHKIVRQMTG